MSSTVHGAPRGLFDRNQPNHHRPCKLGRTFPTDDNEYIHIGHSISIYPMDPHVNLGFDGNLISTILVGNRNDPASCLPTRTRHGGWTDVHNLMLFSWDGRRAPIKCLACGLPLGLHAVVHAAGARHRCFFKRPLSSVSQVIGCSNNIIES